jgi:hypothetical protein
MYRIMNCDHFLNLKIFLDQLNLFYILICLYFIIDQELWTRKLIDCIMDCDHFLDQKEVIKFVYCFMILFLMIYIFKYFLLLITFSH